TYVTNLKLRDVERGPGFTRPFASTALGLFSYEPSGSTERLTQTGCRGCLNRVQHAMARDRVVERRAQMRSLSIIAGETRVRLGNVGGSALRRRPPILLWHGQDFECGLRALAATYGHLEDLGLATGGSELQ